MGKTLSNFSFLAVIMLIVLIGAGGTPWIRGEVARLRVGQLLTPFVLVSLPAMTVVAALAVLFEALYMVIWYIGPISGLASLDFIGATPDSIALQQPWLIPLVTAVLLGLDVLGRVRRIRR